jgi:hydrogenase nickel incorporation protein HypA/HybF
MAAAFETHGRFIMHELSILVEVVRIVEEMAEEQKIDKIAAIVLQIGELSSVVPRFLVDYMPYVVDEKPRFADTKLEIETIPGMAMCQKCKTVFNIIENEGYCPNCKSFDKDLLSGQEFFIKEVVVPNG